MIDVQAASGAVVIVGMGAVARFANSGITATTTGDPQDVFTSLGVFGAALGIAYFMLRRGDNRERDMQHSMTAAIEALRAELAAARAAHAHETEQHWQVAVALAACRSENEALKAKDNTP